MQEFYGTKRINAKPMTRAEYNIFRGWELPSNENGDDTGYLVEYLDGGKPNVEGFAGYVIWSPSEQFEKAYQPTTALSFGHALVALQEGKRVARAGWNGKGMWLHLVPRHDAIGQHKDCLPYVVLNYPNGSTPYPDGAEVPWLASQTDMLANDWQIVE